MLEVNDAPLGATANRSRDVKNCGFWRPARHDKGAQRLQFFLARVDGVLQLRDSPVVHLSLGKMVAHFFQIGR